MFTHARTGDVEFFSCWVYALQPNSLRLLINDYALALLHLFQSVLVLRVAILKEPEKSSKTSFPRAVKNSYKDRLSCHIQHIVYNQTSWILIATLYEIEWSFIKIKWAASSEFVTYRLCEQRRFRRACASAQSRQNLRCSLIQPVSQEDPSDRKPDPWPFWMAGHAHLKFVMTECSKTQICLTRHKYVVTKLQSVFWSQSCWDDFISTVITSCGKEREFIIISIRLYYISFHVQCICCLLLSVTLECFD